MIGRTLILGALLLWGAVSQARAQATATAVQLPNGFTQFLDSNGSPIVNGTVAFYVPGTTTPKTTWQDPYQTIVNPQTITLDGAGRALIWGSGIYRQVVKDQNNNLIWDQLSGGYNCTSAAGSPQGANGALQFNNAGIFGGLSLGNSSQVLIGNASGPPTWGNIPVGALPGGTTGTGAFVLQNSPTINTPTINGGTWNNGTFANPTFTGTITGLPGGGTSTAACLDRSGAALAQCIGSNDIFDLEFVNGTPPTGGSINGHVTGFTFAWNVYSVAGLKEANDKAAAASLQLETLQSQVQQIASRLHMRFK